jgi:hypothetical protein
MSLFTMISFSDFPSTVLESYGTYVSSKLIKTKMIHQYPLNNLTATIQFYTPVVEHEWISLRLASKKTGTVRKSSVRFY